MEFLSWHYSYGLRFYLRRWQAIFDSLTHYYSFPILLSSLLSPWKKLATDEKTGLNLDKYLKNASFNFISRFIGAGVRLAIFITGIAILFFVAGGGFLGIFVWLIFPLMGLPFYMKFEKRPDRWAKKLWSEIHNLPAEEKIKKILSSEAGVFFTQHLGKTADEIISTGNISSFPQESFSPNSFFEIIKHLLEQGFFDKEKMSFLGLSQIDFENTAHWWDSKLKSLSDMGDEAFTPGRPGIGLELLFGYTPTLNKHSVDMSSPTAFSSHLIGRVASVSRIERVLSSGSSVMIVGEPGVGKKTVVLEFARRAASGELGASLAYRRVLEFDYSFLLSGSTDINQKRVDLLGTLSEASSAGNIILVLRDLHRLTNQEIEGIDFTDVFERYLEKRNLKIIAISSNSDYERFLASNLRLRKFFEVIEVVEPTKDEAMEILLEAANTLEGLNRITITTTAIRNILDNSSKYITDIPFPEKALEILDSSITYCMQRSEKVVLPEHVNQVLSEKTGISFSALNGEQKNVLGNLEKVIHESLINQERAVSLIAKSLRARSLGIKDDERPTGSFLFLGPTGVGKTQTAKSLAKVYFGSEKEIIRFDMAEFAGGEGIARLIGSQQQNIPGILTTAIKNRPASLLLLDEIEKAPAEVYNLLLTLLDEGYITDAFNKKIDCRHLFVIATSNAGAEKIRELVAGNISGEDLQRQVVDYVQTERIFSPEFLNRFDGVVVFEPLTKDDLIEVAKMMLADLATTLKNKNIYLEIDESLCEAVATDSFDPAFGARPMRRLIDLNLGDLIGKAILDGVLKPGDRFKISKDAQDSQYSIVL